MDQNDRSAILGLFDRLAEAERSAAPRDPEAQAFIAERIAAQPGAPYMMAQTIVALEMALAEANARAEAAARPRGFFDSLFGDDRRPAPAQARPAAPMHPQAAPAAGGGFLAGAAQTAVGVAGGVLLGSAIGSMFAADPAEAAEPAPEDADFDADLDL